MSKANNPMGQAKANSPPKAVATPLPPRKLKKIGNKCPKKAKQAIHAKINNGNPRYLATITGSQPLSTSSNKTILANPLPPILNTLLAPGFPEPCDRGSGNPAHLQIITALDKEPIKYADKQKINGNSMVFPIYRSP